MTQLACVDATVTRREELSEHLVRVHVAGEQLRTMPWGEQGPGPRADSYIKVLIPPAGGAVDVDVADMVRWRREFMAAPREEAGWMRTYTVRDATTVELEGERVPELAIDVVLHGDPEHGMGPGAAWGDSVRAGDSARLLVPSGDSAWWAAWDDGRAAGQDVVIAGDETALPAISAIVDGVEQRVRVNRPVDGAYEPPRSITVAVEVPAEADAVPGAGPRALARAASCDEPGAHRVVLDGGRVRVGQHEPRAGHVLGAEAPAVPCQLPSLGERPQVLVRVRSHELDGRTLGEQRGHPARGHRPGTHHEHPAAGEVQTQGVGHGRGTPEATAERKPPCYVRVRGPVPRPSRGVTLPRTGLTRSRRPASSSP